MATITANFVNGTITLSDNGKTNASKSEVIHWQPGSGVIAITAVVAKSNSPVSTADFWNEAPAQNGVNFKGKIGDNIQGSWDYDISCNIGTIQNPDIITLDPRIQVNS